MKNIAASIRTRLLALSKKRGEDFLALLIRYATDRLLYRVSVSDHQNSFILKGSLLFSIWNAEMHRPTRDADLLGCGEQEEGRVGGVFGEICSIDCAEDGLIFDLESLSVETIRDDEQYEGNRVRIKASLDGAEVTVQVDIGYGDTITPAVESVELPAYLGMPPAKLRAYPKETVISEKAEALVKLGIANSRMKDFFDIKWLADHYQFDGDVLARAIAATFLRRKTELPTERPVGLSEEFYHDETKQRQWNAFARRLKPPCTERFEAVGDRVMQFLLPPLLGAHGEVFDQRWTAGKGWRKGGGQKGTVLK